MEKIIGNMVIDLRFGLLKFFFYKGCSKIMFDL